MPAKSIAQREAAAMALSALRGEINFRELKGGALQMYSSMNEQQLKDFAETKEAHLPARVKIKKTAKPKAKQKLRIPKW